MTTTGDWTLHFNWGNTDHFAQAKITLNGDGTFAGPGPGDWYQRDGRILLSFDTGPAKYGGTVTDKIGSGAMTTFAGLTGTWYMTKHGVLGATSSSPHSNGLDAAGNQR